MKKIMICLLAALALVLAACRAQANRKEDGLRLWFAAPAERQSRDVTAALDTESYEGVEGVAAMLTALLAGPPADSELATLFPPGTRVERWSMEGRTVRVELSEGYAQLSGVDQTIADYCIALTLCQLPHVDAVELSAGDGDRRLLRVSDVMFSGAEENPEAESALIRSPD